MQIFEDVAAQSASIGAAAPENVLENLDECDHSLDVVLGEDEKKLTDEKSMNIKERLELYKEFSEKLTEAVDNKTVVEELATDMSPLNTVRYKLQDWHNGKGDGTDHETKYDGPSDYEAWRRGIIDKKRKARLEQENADRTSPFRSPSHTDTNFETLDNQRDDFLKWYVDKFGPHPDLK